MKTAPFIPLTFEHFSEQNKLRCREFRNAAGERCHSPTFPADPHETDWSIADWTNAAAGEIGEACNIAKKIRRGDFDNAEDYDAAREACATELVDAIIYADACITKLGLRTVDVLVHKFNLVSNKVRSARMLNTIIPFDDVATEHPNEIAHLWAAPTSEDLSTRVAKLEAQMSVAAESVALLDERVANLASNVYGYQRTNAARIDAVGAKVAAILAHLKIAE